jgi:hypothetical protein
MVMGCHGDSQDPAVRDEGPCFAHGELEHADARQEEPLPEAGPLATIMSDNTGCIAPLMLHHTNLSASVVSRTDNGCDGHIVEATFAEISGWQDTIAEEAAASSNIHQLAFRLMSPHVGALPLM